jgi:hypothetical protein
LRYHRKSNPSCGTIRQSRDAQNRPEYHHKSEACKDVASEAVSRGALKSGKSVGFVVGSDTTFSGRGQHATYRRQHQKHTIRPGKTIKLSDGGGLQIWLIETGSKLWYQAYRFGGKQRKLAIGPYPRIGLKEARQQRDEAKRQIEAASIPAFKGAWIDFRRLPRRRRRLRFSSPSFWTRSGERPNRSGRFLSSNGFIASRRRP